jgi:capsid protein
MNLVRDAAHILNSVKRGFNSLPSKVTDAQRLQSLKTIALRRARAARPNDYYPGADMGVMRGDWLARVTSATSNTRTEFKALCARSELAYRTDAWARRAIQVLGTFVVGQGIKPYPSIRDASGELNEAATNKLAQDWQRFNDQGMRNGSQQLTVYEGQRLEFITIGVYGNSLCNFVNARPGAWLRQAMQIIKPTRLDFSKDNYFDASNYEQPPKEMIVHGIEINQYGEPVQFWLEGVAKPISAKNMVLNYYPIETESYLGMPWMTQSLGNIWDNQQIFSDKLKQSRTLAKLGIRLKKEDQEAFGSIAEPAGNGEDYIDLDYQGFVTAADGSLAPIKMDDSLKDSFNPLVKHNLIELGVGMGFSYQVLSSDLEGMNFAASRANIINDNRWFRSLFKWYTKTVLQRRYERFVEMEIFQNKVPGVSYQNFLDDPWAFTQCYWLPMDGEEWVDPLRDAESIKLLYGLGQITYQEICAMSGKDWRSTYAQLKKERDLFKADDMLHLLPNYQPATSARKDQLILNDDKDN